MSRFPARIDHTGADPAFDGERSWLSNSLRFFLADRKDVGYGFRRHDDAYMGPGHRDTQIDLDRTHGVDIVRRMGRDGEDVGHWEYGQECQVMGS